jgi:ABC-type transporter Mla subunit MlaD
MSSGSKRFRRNLQQSAFANPVMVGALTVLAVLVALFLSYNANQGLPFLPTRVLKVDVADGADLILGNDVRQGGYRIGLLADVQPIKLENGQAAAQLTLKLQKAQGDVPVDSRITILERSLLGLKYVDLEKGKSRKIIPDGGTLPIQQTYVPVQFDDIFKTFDAKTRHAIQQSLVGTGDTLAARGSDLNDTIHNLPERLGHLQPVAHYLADSNSGLTRFLSSLNGFMSTVTPVAPIQVALFRDAATTFQAIIRDPNAYEQTIAESPSTLSVSTDSLIAQRPFLADLTTFGRFFSPATGSLRRALPDINPAIEEGTRVLFRTPSLDANLQSVMDALKRLALAPGTNVAINALSDTVNTLNPMIRYLGPFQTVCDGWNYWFTYYAEHLSQPTAYGFSQRVLLNSGGVPGTPGGVGAGVGATEPANGNAGSNLPPLSNIIGGQEYLHSQQYGAAVDTAGNADCESGQRGYPLRLSHYDPLRRNIVTDSHTPGDQGPTFHGRSRVPAGETFTRAPQIGPQLVPTPQNP